MVPQRRFLTGRRCRRDISDGSNSGRDECTARESLPKKVLHQREFPIDVVQQAHALLTNGQFSRYEKCIGVAKWLLDLHSARAAAKHGAFHPLSGSTVATCKGALADYDTSKGTIRFPFDAVLPAKLVKLLVATRIGEIRQEGKQATTQENKAPAKAQGKTTAAKPPAVKKQAVKKPAVVKKPAAKRASGKQGGAKGGTRSTKRRGG